jgi:hypothetical protein
VTLFSASDKSKQQVLKVLPQLVILVVLGSLPFLFWYILNKYKDDLYKPTMKAKIGSIYLGVKTDTETQGELLSSSVFVVRRLLFIMVTHLLSLYPCMQVQIWISLSLYYIGYFMIVQPYDSKFAMYLEYVNEILFLVVCYHFILLTDVVSDKDARDGIGWSLIAAIGAIMVLNFGVIIGVNISAVLRKAKLNKLKANAIK